ncbi:MAG: caspase family protein [Methanothrix sp.]|nr:caspase family protein [Methanothrix sp.]
MAKPAQDAASTDLTAENLNRLVWDYERSAAAVSSEDSHAGINNTYIAEYLHSADHKKSRHKNYAVIVGIDEYDDRTSLHTCVNDANSIADLMKTLGYEVILLSDNTEKKPTKRNILDVALKDVSLKQNKGNIIFYFSGHGMHDSNNTFYLIPKDSNGDSTSYISEYELKQYIKDLDNLALIIDACDSEGLSESVGNGQLIIASSKKNEASNEEWTGSLSVFTSRLIEAIREEGRTSNKILLQKCFYRAYNDTVKWGQGILLHQTPVIMDLTGKKHYVL